MKVGGIQWAKPLTRREMPWTDQSHAAGKPVSGGFLNRKTGNLHSPSRKVETDRLEPIRDGLVISHNQPRVQGDADFRGYQWVGTDWHRG